MALLAVWLAAPLSMPGHASGEPAETRGRDNTQRKTDEARRARARARRQRKLERRRRRMRAQRRARARWHQPASRRQVRRWLHGDPPPLVLHSIDHREHYKLTPRTPHGGFGPDQRARARKALASEQGKTHPIHPRVLELLYDAAQHFRAPYVHVLSGYRDDRPTSRHSHGRAVDLVVPGVRDRQLASWLSKQGFVGVGLYPNDRFVHLDVRHKSYFWIHRPGTNRAVFRKRARRVDAQARKKGDTRVRPLQAVLHTGQ